MALAALLTPTEQAILSLLGDSGEWLRGYELAASACQGSTNRLQADGLARWHIWNIRRKLGYGVIVSSPGNGYKMAKCRRN